MSPRILLERLSEMSQWRRSVEQYAFLNISAEVLERPGVRYAVCAKILKSAAGPLSYQVAIKTKEYCKQIIFKY